MSHRDKSEHAQRLNAGLLHSSVVAVAGSQLVVDPLAGGLYLVAAVACRDGVGVGLVG